MKNMCKFFGGGANCKKYIATLLLSLTLFLMAIPMDVSAASGNLSTLENPEIGDFQEYSYTGGIQSFTAPVNGLYLLNASGATGGDNSSGGRGATAQGYVVLKKGQTIFICVGGTNNRSGSYGGGGYNGGGHGASGGEAPRSYGGGGCTSITSTNRGVLSNFNNYRDEVYLVAAGGGGNWARKHSKKYYINASGYPGGGESNAGTQSRLWDTEDGGSSTVTIPSGAVSDQTRGYAFGQGQSSRTDEYSGGGGGGGWMGGYAGYCREAAYDDHAGTGGSSYIAGCPAVEVAGVTYSASCTAGAATAGHGSARVTFILPLISADFEKSELSLTDDDTYTLKCALSNVTTYEVLKKDALDADYESLFVSSSAKGESRTDEADGISFSSNIDVEGDGSFTLSFMMDEDLDGTTFKVEVSNEDGDTASSTCTLGMTAVDRNSDKIIVTAGDTRADVLFSVKNAKTAVLQVQDKAGKVKPVEEDWCTYTPPVNHTSYNPITSSVRSGDVKITISDVVEDDYYKWYRVVLTNDGSGLVSEPILVTHNIYNLHYSPKKETVGEPADVIYFNGVEVNGIYMNGELIYGFDAS